MKYREVTKKLKKLGCQELPRRGGGFHRKWYNPLSGGMAPVPDWGSKDLKTGTLRKIVRLLDLDWQEFKQT